MNQNMTHNIFETTGKRMPYTMPEGFNVEALMANAIAIDGKRRTLRKRLWGGGAFTAAASIAALIAFSILIPSADPVNDYKAALADYCEQVTDDERQLHETMLDADLVSYMDTYEEYYNSVN